MCLTPAQEVGMALAHSLKVSHALQRAAAAGAIVVAREPIERLVAAAESALEARVERNEPVSDALELVLELFAEEVGA